MLLKILTTPTFDLKIRLMVCEIAGALGSDLLEPSEWPAIFQTAPYLCRSAALDDREVGLNLLGQLADVQIKYHSESFISTAVELFAKCFKDFHQNGKGLVITIKALDEVISSVRSMSQLDMLKPLIPVLFQEFGSLIQFTVQTTPTEDRYLCSFIEQLIEVIEHSPEFFTAQTDLFLPSVLDCIIHETRITPSFQFQLMEFVVTLVQAAPKRVKKMKISSNNAAIDSKEYFIRRFLPHCLELMSHVSHNGAWERSDTVEDMDTSSACDVGEAAFYRVTVALGVTHVYPVVSALLTQYLFTSADWQRHYAGLQCIAVFSEVSALIQSEAQLAQHQREVLTTLLHFTSAAHARVKAAAFAALSQFLLHHGSCLPAEQFMKILTAIAENLPQAKNPSPRARRAVMIALIHVIESAPEGVLTAETTRRILSLICSTLQEGPTIVQETCISAVISTAEVCRGSSNNNNNSGGDTAITSMWQDCYNGLVSVLKDVLRYSFERGLETLWAQTLESITLIGECAGRALFERDAHEIMNLLTTMQTTTTIERYSDVEIALMKAWVRLA